MLPITEKKNITWQPQTVAQNCTIELQSETDASGGNIAPKKRLRTIMQGDLITLTGGAPSFVIIRIGDQRGEKVSLSLSEAAKILVNEGE